MEPLHVTVLQNNQRLNQRTTGAVAVDRSSAVRWATNLPNSWAILTTDGLDLLDLALSAVFAHD